ncbi:MAG: hypothetical protein IKA00_07545 [Prevotella sp.]|nr:hypothetical protein [Prevotella sp.]
MQNFESTLNISNHTVQLYRELFGEPHPVGSGLLICNKNQHLLISANHVIDSEDKLLKIENDPDEVNIPHDDMESIMAKGRNFYYVNDKEKALLGTFNYDNETKEVVFNDDIEWCVCELSADIVKYFIENDKTFYTLDERLSINIKSGTPIIVSGYPGYAQKENQEIYRSFLSELIENFRINESGLFRVQFNQSKAYCIELEREIQLPRSEGISGMSGGGLWYEDIDKFIPLGIIIKQDPNENYIEGYSLYEILKSYSKDNI